VIEPIRATVAEILNKRELVITAGSEDGVTPGMKFAVLNRKGVDVKDPDTGAVLGSVDIPKVLLEAVRIQSHLAVARTYRKETKNVGGAGPDLSSLALFRPPQLVEITETLQLSEKPYEEELAEEESYVKRGDPVVQVLGKEYEID
jgi:hypothetical protein